jgi:hypothetical protein
MGKHAQEQHPSRRVLLTAALATAGAAAGGPTVADGAISEPPGRASPFARAHAAWLRDEAVEAARRAAWKASRNGGPAYRSMLDEKAAVWGDAREATMMRLAAARPRSLEELATKLEAGFELFDRYCERVMGEAEEAILRSCLADVRAPSRPVIRRARWTRVHPSPYPQPHPR